MGLGITVLGCSGTWASAASACSGYLVDDGTTRIWLDCGPGTMVAIQQHCALTEVDAVVVSHEHPDHCGELPIIRNAYRHGLGRRDVPLYAPGGVFAVLESAVGRRGITPAFLPKLIGDRSVAQVGGLRLTFSRTDHPVETLAVRVDDVAGGSGAVAYSADTADGWSISALGDGIDVAVVEATFLDDDPTEGRAVHRTARQTGEDARRAGIGRLVVTHVPPNGDGEAVRAEAAEAFGGPTELATPHQRYAP